MKTPPQKTTTLETLLFGGIAGTIIGFIVAICFGAFAHYMENKLAWKKSDVIAAVSAVVTFVSACAMFYIGHKAKEVSDKSLQITTTNIDFQKKEAIGRRAHEIILLAQHDISEVTNANREWVNKFAVMNDEVSQVKNFVQSEEFSNTLMELSDPKGPAHRHNSKYIKEAGTLLQLAHGMKNLSDADIYMEKRSLYLMNKSLSEGEVFHKFFILERAIRKARNRQNREDNSQ